MTLKVQKTVRSCAECPHRQYASSTMYQCVAVDEIIYDKDIIPVFCPLPDYPSRQLAELEQSVRAYQAHHERSFTKVLMLYVASRLSRAVSAGGTGVKIPIQKGEEVYLDIRHIVSMTVWPLEISFHYRDALYRLSPEVERVQLRRQSEKERDLWVDVQLR